MNKLPCNKVSSDAGYPYNDAIYCIQRHSCTQALTSFPLRIVYHIIGAYPQDNGCFSCFSISPAFRFASAYLEETGYSQPFPAPFGQANCANLFSVPWASLHGPGKIVPHEYFLYSKYVALATHHSSIYFSIADNVDLGGCKCSITEQLWL